MNTTTTTKKSRKSPFADRLTKIQADKVLSDAVISENSLREKLPLLHSRDLRILGGLGPQTSAATISVFSRWNRLDKRLGTKAPRTIFVDCGQGTFADMFAVYDVVRVCQDNDGPPVTVQTTGLADTKAAIVMQAAKRRIMTPRSWIILSEIQPRQQLMSTAEGIETVKYMKWLENRGWNLLLQRANATQPSKALDLAQIKANTEYGRQWWISAQESLELGLIDEIGTVMPSHCEYEPPESLLVAESDSDKVRLDKAKIRFLTSEERMSFIATTYDETSPEKSGKHYFFGDVDTDSCTAAESSMLVFAQRKQPAVEMVINSPGGSVTSGCGLIDVIEQTTRECDFTTTIFGQCASMAGFIAMTGKKRVMAKNAAFLIHRVSTMFGMSSSHMDDNTKNMKRLEDMLFPWMASRTNGKLPVEELRTRCDQKDWWLTADECLQYGLVDELI